MRSTLRLFPVRPAASQTSAVLRLCCKRKSTFVVAQTDLAIRCSRINNFSPVPSRLSASPFPCFQFVILRTVVYDSPRANIRRSCVANSLQIESHFATPAAAFYTRAHGFSKPFRAPGSPLHARLQKRAICGRETRGTKGKGEARTCGAPVTLIVDENGFFAIQRVRTPILKIAVSIGVSHCCSSA